MQLQERNQLEEEMRVVLKRVDDSLLLDFKPNGTEQNSAGSYTFGKSITLRWNYMQQDIDQMLQLGTEIDEKSLAWMVFVHEIGHHIDFTQCKFSVYHNEIYALDRAISNCDKRQLHFSYRRYFREQIRMETVAWELGEMYLPNFIDREVYKKYASFCIKSYTDKFSFNYRLLCLKADLNPLLKSFLGQNRTYYLTFTEQMRTTFDQPSKHLYLNVADYAMRLRTRSHKRKMIETNIVSIIDHYTETEEVLFPRQVYSYESYCDWIENELLKMERAVRQFIALFGDVSYVLHLYREGKKQAIEDMSFFCKQYKKQAIS